MIEIFLEILMAVFAVFGLYAFAHALGTLALGNDRIATMLLIDSAAVASEIEMYVFEAQSNGFWLGGHRTIAVIRQPYATPELLEILNKKGIPYEIVCDPSEV